MGNQNGCFECFEVPNYIIYVKTGDTKGAGLHNSAEITLINDAGDESEKTNLNGCCVTVFKKGRTDSFKVRKLPNFGTIKRIIIQQDKSQEDVEWFIEKITVRHIDEESEGDTIFPVHRWLRHRALGITQYDSCLPQFEMFAEQRAHEISMKRVIYAYRKAAEDLPPQMKNLPRDEVFSNFYKWDFVQQRLTLFGTYNIPDYERPETWKSFEEIENIFKPVGKFRRPMALKEDWQSDLYFGRQRLRGSNPLSLKICKYIPENFNIKSGDLDGLLESFSLNEAIELNKLFIVNHSILDGMLDTENKQIIPSPMALFYLNINGDLMPVAIQLYQLPNENNPVFFPTDPKFTWLLAKMWFNHADATYQRICLLITSNHWILEMIAISVHRTLSPSHPIFRLLAPYIKEVLAINHYGMHPLLTTGGWIDQNTSLRTEGTLELIRRFWQQYQFTNGIKETIDNNGVRGTNVLKEFPLRDDSMLLENCIEKYATQVVEGYYVSEKDLIEDFEIQSWAAELVGIDSCFLKGVPGNGMFTDQRDLISVLSTIICKATLENAALTLPLYDEAAFVPSYPLMLRGRPPINKEPVTEADIMVTLPTKHVTMETVVYNKMLSERESSGLADSRAQYQYDAISLPARERFLGALRETAAHITIRNRERAIYYDYLNPASKRIIAASV